MGKKKNKNKVSGAVKTAAKTEKKLANKMKKELANLGEEDIAKVIAEIEREEAKRSAATEKSLPGPPTPRAYASFTPHPTKDEIIMFGGEYHNGQQTEVYNELLFYNPANNTWKQVKAPSAPPPRSAHQAVATPANKGELWIFGGEFTSPSETQFHHYKDLWCFSLADKKWEKVVAKDGPSPRSGHRMALVGRRLIVFGGYADDGRECRYFDDLYAFCLDTRTWSKVVVSGRGPCARSACVMLPVGNDGIIIYGGFSRVRDGRTERTHTHTDLFRLSARSGWALAWRGLSGGALSPPARAGQAAAVSIHGRGYVFGGVSCEYIDITVAPSAPTYTDLFRLSARSGGALAWRGLSGGALSPPARAGQAAAVSIHGRGYVFGGVSDVEETEEELKGEMSDELLMLDLEGGKWHSVTLKGDKATSVEEAVASAVEGNEEKKEDVTVVTDEVFTMKLGSAPALARPAAAAAGTEPRRGPSPRMSAMMAIQRSTLYVYGGVLEKEDKQFYLSDMYSLDLHKLTEWRTIIEQPPLPDWLGSDSEYDSESGSGSETEDSESDDE